MEVYFPLDNEQTFALVGRSVRVSSTDRSTVGVVPLETTALRFAKTDTTYCNSRRSEQR